MPRKKLVRSSSLPYHLTARTNNREIFHGDISIAWQVITNELYLQQILFGVRIHAFVLMPNHFHLLATSSHRGIDLVMKEVLGSATRVLNTRNGRSGHVFGGRYHWSLIQQPDYYAHALKYVLRNPVKAGLCSQVSEHPFSTYSGQLGLVHLPVSLSSPHGALGLLIPNELEAVDVWLNAAHPAEQNEAIRKALRRKEFKLPANKARRVPLFPV